MVRLNLEIMEDPLKKNKLLQCLLIANRDSKIFRAKFKQIEKLF